MTIITYRGVDYDLPNGENLLDGLLARGAEIPHGCRSGACQSCLLKCIEGPIPPDSQRGLKEAQVLNGYLLACQCYPEAPMALSSAQDAEKRIDARVSNLRKLTPNIIELTLEPSQPIPYRAGQFIRLYNPEGAARSYSLASVDGLDHDLILHIREYPNGLLSSWVHHSLHEGDTVQISEAIGDCFYIPGKPLQPLLLIGTGSGLAPLSGILRDALRQGHAGPIHLYHGARNLNGLYLTDDFHSLSKQHHQFIYHPCVSDPETIPPAGIEKGRASDLALKHHPELKGWRVYLCGNPKMVRATQMQAYLAGASLDAIHIDPFDSQSNA